MRLLIVVIAIAAAPAFVDAQTSFGLAVGVSTVGAARYDPRFDPGPTLTAFISRSLSHRFAARLEASVSHLSLGLGPYGVATMCALGPDDECVTAPASATLSALGIASLTATTLVAFGPADTSANLYLIGGAGPYYVHDQPEIGGITRLGIGIGGGCAIPLGRRSRAFVEARYQLLLDAPAELGWIVPVTVGVRF
jgi:hypothetical protein